jgi:cytochrome P450
MVKHTLRRIAAWTPGSTQPIDHEMADLTMSIIAETLFNAEVGPEADAIGAAVTTVLSIMNERFNRLIPTPNWLPIPENRVFKREIARLDALIQRFIDERRRTGEDRGDLLSMLLLAQDEDDGGFMTDKQVRDEAITLFGAGHETTSNALMWTFYCLSEHPEVEARLHAEVDSVLGDRPPTLEDLPRLPYTEMVIKESMRLYPPAWATTREPNTDVIVGGWPVKRGEVILLNIYGVHRDARFFPDPERFDPERFRPENEKLIPKYAYLPFGSGPRVCIGNAFAMMEARLILATIAQRFALRLAPGHTVKPERMFTLRAKGGMPMIVVPRQPAAEPVSALAEPV